MSGFGFTVRSFLKQIHAERAIASFFVNLGVKVRIRQIFVFSRYFAGFSNFFVANFCLSFSTSLVVFPSNINQAFLTSPRFPASHQRPDSLIHPRLDPTRLAPRLRLYHFSVPNVGDFPGTLHFVGFFLAVFSVQFTPRSGF